MRSMRLLPGVFLASIALSLGTVRADDDIVERVDSKNIVVTDPKADAAFAKDAGMTVTGTVKVAPGAKAPDIVIVKFTSEKEVELGSYGLRLDDEENEYGVYELKDGVYTFRFKVNAPNQAGKCKLTVVTIGGGGPGRKIERELSKPIAIEIH